MEGRSDGVGVAATTGRLTVIFGVACMGVSTRTVLLIVARISLFSKAIPVMVLRCCARTRASGS